VSNAIEENFLQAGASVTDSRASRQIGMARSPQPESYPGLLHELKARIRSARVKAALAVNAELITLYWGIGKEILARQEREGWGAKVLERLSVDLRRAFPGMRGLSKRNLIYMRDLAREWPGEAIVQQLVAQLPWGHNILLIQKVKALAQREWYARACIKNGWSRNVFEMQIETGLYARQGRVASNFDATLPAPQSDLAQALLKDPYHFEFLGLTEEANERTVERGLVTHMRDFLLELGQGFAFVGSQVPIEVSAEVFYIDLLFYHLKLRSFVVIELKAGSFKPEFASKLNFYLSAVDDLLRHHDDRASIGLVLCRGGSRRDGAVVEYSLRDMGKPLGVAEYRLGIALPDELKDALPSVAELKAELRRG
jgi:predicted nuclease of restriction endonuclease-like (RecB) superfamily